MKKREMDETTGLMVVFFAYLSRCVNSRFDKLNRTKMEGVILRQIKEYGFVRRKGLHPTWTATRKLIRATTKSPKDWIDHHPDYLTLIDRTAQRICSRDGGICPGNKWHVFELEFSAIFEYEYRHCIRWMKEVAKLTRAKDKFSREAFLVAWGALFNAALSICAADYDHKMEPERTRAMRRRAITKLNPAIRRNGDGRGLDTDLPNQVPLLPHS
jgi:hypothetical protein